MFKKFAFTCLTFFLVIGCNSPEENRKLTNARDIIAEVSGEFVPDKRVARFEMEAREQDGDLVVQGESDLPEAVEKLRSRLKENDIIYVDSIALLPGNDMDNALSSLVTISGATLR